MEARAYGTYGRHRDVEPRGTTLRVVNDAELEEDFEDEEWEGDPTRRPSARKAAQLRKEQLRVKYGRY